MKLRMPTKLGYQGPGHIVAISVTNEYPGGCWENQDYNWFGGSCGYRLRITPFDRRLEESLPPGSYS